MNFFKNLTIYRITNPLSFMVQSINMETRLQPFVFTPCGSQDMAKSGWVPATDQHQTLVHQGNGQMLLTMRREEKVLPSVVIRKAVDERVHRLEQEQGRKLKKTEKDALKDEVLHRLLPRAFSKDSYTRLWIDTVNGLIIVDTASARQAENALALLRKSLGSLPVVPLTIGTPIELTITEWVRSGSVPAGFMIGDSAELKATLEGGGIANVKKQELVSDEIQTHIEAGKVVTRLALDWQERIDFTLSDQFTLRRLKFSDVLVMQNDDIDHEDVLARFDADFLLMTGELTALIKALVTALGGEAKR